jgi:DNA primase
MTDKPLISNILARYGIEYNGKAIKCPLPDHDERTGSFSIYRGGTRAHCFGCQFDGDGADLISAMEKIPAKEAMAKAGMETGFHTLQARPQAPKKPQTDSQTIEVLTAFHSLLTPIGDSSPGRQYLAGRGISADIAGKLGVAVITSPGAVYDAMAARFGRERLQAAGLFSSKGKMLFFRPSLVFPHFDDEKNIVYLTSRILQDNVTPKSYKLAGNLTAPFPHLPGDGQILICEGQADILAFYQLFGDEIPIITFCGLPSIAQIQQVGSHRCILALDFDAPGKAHTEKLKKQFPGVGYFRWADYLESEGLPGTVKDFGDCVQNIKLKGLEK